ncbi:DNA polymerase III subunit alpha [Angustibacter sp. McL0619]|uniref:DNA polymerase III subunit alpha n=1 Tax=Angustibacter sp. McL0619 TaxID=3415676 RepID=UPI003CECDE72
MTSDFVHLHVASGYSLRHGASSPQVLVDRAVEQRMSALALTDRDGLYGAVKFVLACQRAGIAPLLGVDLATAPTGLVDGLPGWADPSAAARAAGNGRTPVRGGALVDPYRPRVTVLAHGPAAPAGAGAGWAALCRLTSAAHLASAALGGERGTPVTDLAMLARHASTPTSDGAALTVLLGPSSEVGRAVLARRPDLARAVLSRWREVLPEGSLAIEVVCHHGPPNGPLSVQHAGRMLALARAAGLPAVLTNAVRYATPDGAATADVLDATRRLVTLDVRHLDRVTAQGYLADGATMTRTAEQVVATLGGGSHLAHDEVRRLLADTAALAGRCELDPRADLGIGSVHLPEPAVLGLSAGQSPSAVLRERVHASVAGRYPGAPQRRLGEVGQRLAAELDVIDQLGYQSYFLTVAAVCDLIRGMGVRVAARGSGAGSLVNYLLGISGVDPIEHGLLMERFCSPLRAQLPDIDIDVESARRTEVYEQILQRFGGERVTCVSMMDTYRVRHAVRDVGAALGLPPVEVDAIAKSFPHIRARNARTAIAELPELRTSGLGHQRLDLLFEHVERLDALPRHIALHPCGVVLSDITLLDRTPVEASWLGFPMSQFDKDDVEAMGLLKLDVLGIRMQSAMAHAVDEIIRVDGVQVDLDDRSDVPLDDEATFRLIRSTHTLGCFQIESPGQRELVGKFGPETFDDIVIDISLFRPGPVKSDMVTPFLQARHGWRDPEYLHPSLRPVLEDTGGVVVFHEQVLQIVAVTTGVSLAEADEVRRAMGSPAGQLEVEAWWRPAARARGYTAADVERIWLVLKAFASFGFCKAHAAAFALPTYQSAWLKAHHPAAFLAGVLTHDPGMYPKRLILDDARSLGIAVLGLDVNASDNTYRVERLAPWDEPPPAILDQLDAGPQHPDDGPRPRPHPDLPDGRDYGIRLSLADVKGITDAEVERIVAGRPYASLADFWHRARASRPVVERLVVAGAFDSLYGLGGLAARLPVRRRGQVTRRDLMLQVVELDRWTRATTRGTGLGRQRAAARVAKGARGPQSPDDVRALAAAQSQAAAPAVPAAEQPVQLALDLGDAPDTTRPTGLPEMTMTERVHAELEVLGLDASAHIVDAYAPMLDALGVTRSKDLLDQRNQAELLVAGVKVATQTPPIRSGRRVVFLTLDDSTGPVDATFFEDVQGPYAATVFHSWLLVVRGVLRRTGPRGVSLRATGAWQLPPLWEAWTRGGLPAVHAALDAADVLAHAQAVPDDREEVLVEYTAEATVAAAASRSTRPVMVPPQVDEPAAKAGGMGAGQRHRRVLVHASGFKQSPYADVKPPGEDVKSAPRKLWHSSPGSSGR